MAKNSRIIHSLINAARNGKKVMVMDGLSPDAWIVSAAHKEGISLGLGAQSITTLSH